MINGQDIQRQAFDDFDKWHDHKSSENPFFDEIDICTLAEMYADDHDWHNSTWCDV